MFFKKKEKGKVIGRDIATDHPWFNAQVFVECPDNTKISFFKSVKSKNELPKKGDEIPLKEGKFGFELTKTNR